MTGLNREELQLEPTGQLALDTIDKVISGYMGSLKSKENALDIIAIDLANVEMPLYSKGKSAGFNINRKRFNSVILNAYFYTQDYQSTLNPLNKEYKLFEDILDAYEYYWHHPLSSVSNKKGMFQVYQFLLTWLESKDPIQGDEKQALYLLQSIYIVLHVAKLNASELSPLLKSFIPAEMNALTLKVEEKIIEQYNAIQSSIQQNNFEIDTNKSAKDNVGSAIEIIFSTIKLKNKKHLQNISLMKETVDTISGVLYQVQNLKSNFWDIFFDENDFNNFLSLLSLDEKESTHWKNRYIKEQRNKKKSFFDWGGGKKKSSHFTDEFIVNTLNSAIVSYCNKLFPKEFSSCSSANANDRATSLLQKLEKQYAPLRFLSAQSMCSDYITKLPSPYICSLTSIEQAEEEVTTFESQIEATFQQKKYLYTHARSNLSDLKIQIENILSDLQVAHQTCSKILEQLTPFVSEQEMYVLQEAMCNYASAFDVKAQQQDTVTRDYHSVFIAIETKYESVLNTTQHYLSTLQSLADSRDRETTNQCMLRLETHLQSSDHKSYWAWFIHLLSPAYQAAISACQSIFTQLSPIDLANKRNMLKLREELFEIAHQAAWWDVGKSRSQLLSTYFAKFGFFTPLPPINPIPSKTDETIPKSLGKALV